MNCPNASCIATNTDMNAFCGACGTSLLSATPTPISPNAGSAAMHALMREEIREQLKNEELLTFHVTEAVIAKAQKWFAIPLGLVVALTGFFGYKTLNDFNNKIIEAQDLQKKSQALKIQYEQLEHQLAESTALSERVRTLTNKVDELQSVVFRKAPSLTSDVQTLLRRKLSALQSYLVGVGFPPMRRDLTIDVNAKLGPGLPACYLPDDNLIQINPAHLTETDYIQLNYILGLLPKAQPALAHSGKSGGLPIEYGLAMYFVCSFKDQPDFGNSARTRYSLVGKRRFNSATLQAPNRDVSTVWSETFWQLRSILGRDQADILLTKTLTSLQPSASTDIDKAFARRLVAVSGADAAKIRKVLISRGMSF